MGLLGLGALTTLRILLMDHNPQLVVEDVLQALAPHTDSTALGITTLVSLSLGLRQVTSKVGRDIRVPRASRHPDTMLHKQ